MPRQRADIGLAAADEGDINGLHKFIDFVSRELKTLGVFGEFPEEIKCRVQSLAHEGELLASFINGYRSRASELSPAKQKAHSRIIGDRPTAQGED